MKNKFILFSLTFLLTMSTPCSSYATELTQPEKPDIHNEQAVNQYNQEVGQYNKQIDKNYQEELKEYNNAVDYNAQEKQRVDQANAEQEKIVNQHNTDEDTKVKQNQKELEQYEKDLQQYEEYLNSSEYAADKANADKVLTVYDSIAEYNMAPFEANDADEFKDIYTNHAVDRKIVKEENANLKDITRESTIQVDPAEEKSGKTYTVIVTHYFINPYWQTIKAVSFSKEEVDVNDTVTVTSLANNPSSKLVLEDDEKYCAFYTYISNTYLTCYWYQIYGYAEHTRLKVDSDFSEYNANGNAYSFTLKNGQYYYSDVPYFEVLYYYRYWNTINELLEAPKEVTEYTPDYWNVKYKTPNYLKAVLPIKGKYLSFLKYIPLQNQESITPNRTPVFTTNKTTIIPNVTPKADKSEIIENNPTPLNKGIDYWALLNLIITIISIILTILFVVLYFYKRKTKEENEENNQTIIKKKSFVKRLFSMLCSIVAVIVFILTEDMSLPMQWTDKYTILMAIILILQIIGLIIIRKKKQQDNNN